MLIYHITQSNEWNSVSKTGFYQGDSLSTEGFIHCSTLAQVIPVANLRFHAKNGLVLLCIETDLVDAPIKYENLEGGVELFPHIYGGLITRAVTKVITLIPDTSGNFSLPADLA
jgi:uncharacterized protein (DUF952 family)